MKNRISIIAILIVVVSFVFGLTIKNSGPQTINPPVTQDQPGDTTDIETVVISPEKPASFEGVEMTTYKSPAGYEITYPKTWIAEDTTDSYYKQDALVSAYIIKPLEFEDRYMTDQVVHIAVEKMTLNDLVEEIRSGKNIFIEKNTELLPVTINGTSGLYVPLRDPSARYYFEKNKKLYSLVFLYDPMMNISKQEALWVLSTFKITE